MKFNNQFTNPLLGGHEICYSEIIELKIFRNELNQLAIDILSECPSLIDRVRLNKLLVSISYLCTETLSKIHERI